MGSCSGSTVALNNDKQQEKEKKLKNGNDVVASGSGGGVEKSVVSGVFHQQRLRNLMSDDFRNSGSSAWNYRSAMCFLQCLLCDLYSFSQIGSPYRGYLEEEDIHSYTEFLKELGNGNIENVPTLAIAIDYWHLPKYFTLRDIVVVVRIDEAHHRNVNYFASDSHFQDNN
ncbi:Ubiquinol oxidase 2, mitochondrial [Capsicum annuum]|uniref:Ubiquinol oxidase n=1 Tax=Capsicum annuum TaxID=4072 RepID=A0A2G2YS84_CAPAN|nr:Ubiquinol oxidase 2, mitochondrial [Capsicum annuum]PHT72616.1 Ubiquinol oxidase 2, mitochondrial [Capsicum annuum]